MFNFTIIIKNMHDNSKVLYKAIAKIIDKTRKQKGLKYSLFCYENDIPKTTYDGVVSAKNQSTFYTIAKITKALGLSFEEFGKLLDENLPENLFEIE